MTTATARRPAAGAQTGFPSESPRVATPGRVHLGLDLGTHFGFSALDDNGRIVEAGVWDFTPTARERRGDPGARWARVANQIGAWFAKLRDDGHSFKSVAYEIVHRHEGVLAAHVYGGMEAMLLAQAHRFGIDVDRVEVADVKLIATAKGNARKEAVMLAARTKWGVVDLDAPHDDNLADALFVSELARRRTLLVRW